MRSNARWVGGGRSTAWQGVRGGGHVHSDEGCQYVHCICDRCGYLCDALNFRDGG